MVTTSIFVDFGMTYEEGKISSKDQEGQKWEQKRKFIWPVTIPLQPLHCIWDLVHPLSSALSCLLCAIQFMVQRLLQEL